jgi:predicted SAM-dependent methyltransferase
MDGWVNIDISPTHKTDICGDVLKLDFTDADVIYSCHCIEHLEIADAQRAFNLFYQWLRVGGVLRLSVPSLELATNAYVTNSDMKFLYGSNFKGYYLYDTPCERFNFFMKEWEHKCIYDFAQLGLMLSNAGFMNIGKKQPNESSIVGFNHDRFIPESLYIEVIK